MRPGLHNHSLHIPVMFLRGYTLATLIRHRCSQSRPPLHASGSTVVACLLCCFPCWSAKPKCVLLVLSTQHSSRHSIGPQEAFVKPMLDYPELRVALFEGYSSGALSGRRYNDRNVASAYPVKRAPWVNAHFGGVHPGLRVLLGEPWCPRCDAKSQATVFSPPVSNKSCSE